MICAFTDPTSSTNLPEDFLSEIFLPDELICLKVTGMHLEVAH